MADASAIFVDEVAGRLYRPLRRTIRHGLITGAAGIVSVLRAFGLALVLGTSFTASDGGAQMASIKTGRVASDGATSTCIGIGSSPVCAAETLLACFAKAAPDLCRTIGLVDPALVPHEPSAIEYVIERVSIIRTEDITNDLRDVEWFKPGYALVELVRRTCGTVADDCASASWEDAQIYLRPNGDRWDFVIWRGESGADHAPEIPDAFRGPAKSP